MTLPKSLIYFIMSYLRCLSGLRAWWISSRLRPPLCLCNRFQNADRERESWCDYMQNELKQGSHKSLVRIPTYSSTFFDGCMSHLEFYITIVLVKSSIHIFFLFFRFTITSKAVCHLQSMPNRCGRFQGQFRLQILHMYVRSIHPCILCVAGTFRRTHLPFLFVKCSGFEIKQGRFTDGAESRDQSCQN